MTKDLQIRPWKWHDNWGLRYSLILFELFKTDNAILYGHGWLECIILYENEAHFYIFTSPYKNYASPSTISTYNWCNKNPDCWFATVKIIIWQICKKKKFYQIKTHSTTPRWEYLFRGITAQSSCACCSPIKWN